MSKQEEISAYIKRMIPDIARKCGCTDNEIIAVMARIASVEIFKNQERIKSYGSI